MHDVIIVGIPLLGILCGILFNRVDAKELRREIAELRAELGAEIGGTRNELRAEIAATRAEVLGKIASIEADLRQFYHLTGKL